jgi:hypothetical protein
MFALQQLETATEERCFSVPRCYKEGSWSNELVVRQSPARKNVSTKAENIVEIRHQATTGEDKED